MKIYAYKNYNDYVSAQVEANVRKIGNVWVQETTIKKIHSIKPEATVILCHGTRNGAELKLFEKYYPAASITGTEISHTATQFPNTIQHDFHEQLPNMVGKCDIIYSNSFDHSYDPSKCLSTWINQLNRLGLLFIELIPPGKEKKSDPLVISTDEVVELVNKNSGKVNQIHTVKSKAGNLSLFVIER